MGNRAWRYRALRARQGRYSRSVPGPRRAEKRNYGTAGNTYVAVVEFGRKPVTKSLLAMGESADPSSPHYFDQARLYSEGKFKHAWFERRDQTSQRKSLQTLKKKVSDTIIGFR